MVKEIAYAKVNLFLDVLGKRPDQYHDLEMVMAPIAMHDVVTIKKRKDHELRLTTSKTITESIEDNIVFKAAKHMMENYKLKHGMEIHIQKNIPIAAGLGGGSADCAAALRGINDLFHLRLTKEKLSEIGESFGADVPFCIYNKLCIARGKGEKLFFLKQKLNVPLLLVSPGIKVSTKQVYEALDMKEIRNVKITSMTNAIYNRNCELLVRSLHNALSPYTYALFPEVKGLHDKLSEIGAKGFLMSGSGPTFFVINKERDVLNKIREALKEEYYTHMTKIL